MRGIRQTGAERTAGGRKLVVPSERLTGRISACAILVSLLVTLSGGGPALCAGDIGDEGVSDEGVSPQDISWYPTFEDAKAAAKESGKPVYIHFDSPSAFPRTKLELLDHPMVLPLLVNFECCAHSSDLPANRELARKYTMGAGGGVRPRAEVVVARVSVFTDAEGRGLFARQGYVPLLDFVEVLKDVIDAARLDAALRKTPDDPQLNAQLGHVYVRLEEFKKGKDYLLRALARDPENKVGAFEDATLDLIVLQLPDDPQKAHEALGKYMADFPNTDRPLEVRYYTAVALVAQGVDLVTEAGGLRLRAEIILEKGRPGWRKEVRDLEKGAAALEEQALGPYKQALLLLDTFSTNDKNRPEYDSPWTTRALGLRRQVREAVGLPPG